MVWPQSGRQNSNPEIADITEMVSSHFFFYGNEQWKWAAAWKYYVDAKCIGFCGNKCNKERNQREKEERVDAHRRCVLIRQTGKKFCKDQGELPAKMRKNKIVLQSRCGYREIKHLFWFGTIFALIKSDMWCGGRWRGLRADVLDERGL